MKIQISTGRWPWQWYSKPTDDRPGVKYSWKPYSVPMSRFGGGWGWKLGVCIGRGGMAIDLLFGTVRIRWIRSKEK